ncbi:DsbA family protein [Pseudomonas marginalis]|uniref:DsbA family protein n=1 Tax=Pseudomonas marginalis TaxID=298 RepID=A0A9X9BYZ6_PSEMA|nr:DsbA family protein [Pseudomonas marginalis]TWR63108.1 DsbA family protein [Pseudomonas marginalis]SEB32654.1 Thioredoxin [Pseudomonas marginalis]
MTRPRLRGVILGCLLLGLTLACIAIIRDEMKTPNYTGPWVYGSPDARWTVTEFADLECPYCKTYTPALKSWIQQHKDINLKWHHLPLDLHGPVAVHEAQLAECAGKLGGTQAFWQAIDQTFERTRSNGQGFTGHLDVDGIDHQDLVACAVNNKQIATDIIKQANEASRTGITATPTLIIKDNMTGRTIKLEGPADSVTLLSAIDWLAQKKEQ